MDLQLNEKVVLVTAASTGLGKAAALEFSREGARVVICARSDKIETAGREIVTETGAEILAIRGDVTIQEDIDRLVAATIERYGRIDILILNAGGPPPGRFLDLGPEDWEAAFDLTVMSTVRLCYSVLPHMLEQGAGSIVAIQSYSVKHPIDNLILSNSLRMSVIGLVKSLADELGSKGIRVNSINPAWTWTERVQQLMADRSHRSGRTVEEESTLITENIPLKRMGTVEEFGKTVAWLASPAASFVHGQALMFDGGATRPAL